MSDLPLAPATEPNPTSFFQNLRLPFVFARLGVYLILAATASLLFTWAVHPLVGGGFSPTAPRGLLAGESVALASMLCAAWLMSRLEHRRFGDYGLPLTRDAGRFFAEGAVFGLAEISAVLGSLAAMGYYHFGALAIHGNAILRWAVVWALIFIVVGFVE